MPFSISYIYQVVDKYTRPIRKITKASKRLQSTMKKTSKAVSRFSSKMTSLQSVAGGLAAGMGGKVALDKYVGFETAINKLESVTFGTAKQMSKMKDVAKELGATTQFTAGQAAQGMTFLAMAGLNTEKVLQAIPGALQLAAAGGIELGQAADIATNVLGAMRMEVKDLARVNDVLALAQSKANFNVTELFEAMRPVATTAKNLGIGLEELTSQLAMMANAGEKGSIAGTLLRNAFTQIAGASKGQRKIYRALGINLKEYVNQAGKITNFKGLIAKLGELDKAGKLSVTTLKNLFGMRGFRAVQVLVGAGAKKMGEFEEKMKGAAGSAEKAAKIQMKGLPGVLKTMASAIEAVNIAIFESGLDKILIDMGKWIANTARSISKTNPMLLKMVGIFALAAAIIAPLVVLLGIVGGTIAGIAAFFGTAITPILAVGAAIMGVVTAVGSLIAYKEKVGGFFKDVWSVVTGTYTKGPDILAQEKGATKGPGIVAQGAAATKGMLNGAIKVSAAPGSKIEEAGMKTTMPGNLGFNIAGM